MAWNGDSPLVEWDRAAPHSYRPNALPMGSSGLPVVTCRRRSVVSFRLLRAIFVTIAQLRPRCAPGAGSLAKTFCRKAGSRLSLLVAHRGLPTSPGFLSGAELLAPFSALVGAEHAWLAPFTAPPPSIAPPSMNGSKRTGITFYFRVQVLRHTTFATDC